MAWENDPSDRWRALDESTQKWLLWAIMPGIILHEFTHAAVASKWADVEMDWEEVAVRMHWRPGTPRWAIAAAHLAPTVVGWLVGVSVVLLALVGVSVSVPLVLLIWLLLQWVLYSLAFAGDLNW